MFLADGENGIFVHVIAMHPTSPLAMQIITELRHISEMEMEPGRYDSDDLDRIVVERDRKASR